MSAEHASLATQSPRAVAAHLAKAADTLRYRVEAAHAVGILTAEQEDDILYVLAMLKAYASEGALRATRSLIPLPDRVLAVLQATNAPMTTRELARALDAPNLASVGSACQRLRFRGDVVRECDGEHYVYRVAP